MSASESRRPLEDMIGELVDGLSGTATGAGGLRATRIEFTLPIETRVLGGADGLTVHADMPMTRTRTDFDLPLGRLCLTLDALPSEAPR